MNEEKAQKILMEFGMHEDGTLPFESFKSRPGEIYLEDYFTADQLEAIAWWMKNK